MKSKIKRHSRSVIAVILTISMLISCMMVGLIATDAARVMEDSAVGSWGWSSSYKMGSNVSGGWNNSGQAATHTSGNQYVSYDFYFTHDDTHADGEVRFAFYEVNGGRVIPTTNGDTIDGSSNKKNCDYNNRNESGYKDYYWVYKPEWLPDDEKYYKVTMNLDMKANSYNGQMWYETTELTNFSPTLTVPATGRVGTAITLIGGSTDSDAVGTLSKTYQYSIDNGSTWNDLDSASYTAESVGAVKFRYKVADAGITSAQAYALSDRIEYSSVQECTFSPASCSVSVAAKVKPWVKNATSTGGSLGAVTDPSGTIASLSATPSTVDPSTATDVTLAASSIASGYTFAGWFSDETCETEIHSSSTASDTVNVDTDVDVTYYALFTEDEPTKYSVTYANTATASPAFTSGQSVYKDTEITFTANDLVDGATKYKVTQWTYVMDGVTHTQNGGKTLSVTLTGPITSVTHTKEIKNETDIKIVVNNSAYGSAYAKVGDAKVTAAAEGEEVHIVVSTTDDGAFNGSTGFEKPASITDWTQVTENSEYSFTMPDVDDTLTIKVNFTDYSSGTTTKYWYDGYHTSGSVSSSWNSKPLTEAKLNGVPYSYIHVTGRAGTNSLYTVKNAQNAKLSNGYVYFLAQGSWRKADGQTKKMYVKFYDSSDGVISGFSNYQEMKYGDWNDDQNSKYLWKYEVPAGASKVKFSREGNIETDKKNLSDLAGKYGFKSSTSTSTTSLLTFDVTASPYNGSNVYSTPSGSGKIWKWTDGVYTADALDSLTQNAYSSTYAFLGGSSTVSNYYVVVYQPGKTYTYDGNTIINTTSKSDITVCVSKYLPDDPTRVKTVDHFYAKDGSLRDSNYNLFAKRAWTTITGITYNGAAVTYTGERKSGYGSSSSEEGGNSNWYEINAEIPVGSKVTIQTTLSTSKDLFGTAASGADSFAGTHYVKGFCINGVTYDLLSPSDTDSSTGVCTYTWTIPADYKYDYAEITPIYYLRDTSNTKTFYIEGFDEYVQSQGWGNTLAIYPYYVGRSSDGNAFGGYPGQPLVFYGGKYFVQIPLTHNGKSSGGVVRGMTMSNDHWDLMHRNLDSEAKKLHRQTYDFDDFDKIFKEKNADNIIFSFKYRTAEDNYNDGYPYGASDFGNKSYGSLNNGVDTYTDYFGRDIDVFGNILTSTQKNSTTRLMLVSNGYKDTYVGHYATEYGVFKSTDGGATWSWLTNSDGSKCIIAPSVLYLNNENSFKNFTSGTSTSTGKLGSYKKTYKTLKDSYTGVPVDISFEKTIKNASPMDVANRCDGRWYYSKNTDYVQSNIVIEYDDGSGTFVEDSFGSGANKNVGTATGAKAYFTNTSPNYIYGEVETGKTVIDNDNFFTFTTEDSSDYQFAGWYLKREGVYTKISSANEPSAKSPISSNDTYVARFVKSVSGSLTISHVIENNDSYKGSGTPYLEVTVTRGGETIDKFDLSTGKTFKNNKYIKPGYSDVSFTVKLKTTPADSDTTFSGFALNATASEGTPTTTAFTSGIGTTTTVEGSTECTLGTFTVADILAQNITSLQYVSHLTKATYNYRYKITYTYTSRFYGEQSYVVDKSNEDMSEGYVKAYVSGKQDTATIAKSLIVSNTPYEKNFMQNISWLYDSATQTSNSVAGVDNTYLIEATVTTNQLVDDKVNAEFMIPCEFNSATREPVSYKKDSAEGEGIYIYDEDAGSCSVDSRYGYLFTKTKKSDGTFYHGKDYTYAGASEVVPLIQAPEVLWQNATAVYDTTGTCTTYIKTSTYTPDPDWNGEGDPTDTETANRNAFIASFATEADYPASRYDRANFEYSFDHSSGTVEVTVHEYPISYYNTDGATQLKLVRYDIKATDGTYIASTYHKKFNYSGYQNYVVTPVYRAEGAATDDIDTKYSGTGASISFMDDSRNQWNVYTSHDGHPELDAKTKAGAQITDLDRIYVDFALAFNYQNSEIRKNTTDSIKMGVIIQQLDNLDISGEGEYITDSEYYHKKYTFDKDAMETYISRGGTAPGSFATINSVVAGNTNSGVDSAKNYETHTDLIDNMNRTKYYYYFNQKFNNSSYPEDMSKAYRAVSYIIVNGTVTVSPDPVYFTLYDIANR